MESGKSARKVSMNEQTAITFLIKKHGRNYYQSEKEARDLIIKQMIEDARKMNKDVSFTADEIRTRFTYLRKKYLSEKKQGKENWLHFNSMQGILDDDEEVKTPKPSKRSRNSSELVEVEPDMQETKRACKSINVKLEYGDDETEEVNKAGTSNRNQSTSTAGANQSNNGLLLLNPTTSQRESLEGSEPFDSSAQYDNQKDELRAILNHLTMLQASRQDMDIQFYAQMSRALMIIMQTIP